MKKTLKLENPIQINGKPVSELTYDAQEITAALFSEACARSAGSGKTAAKVRQTDYVLHLYLGMMAVIAVNPDIDIADLERCRGYDTLALADIGMFFTLRKSEAASGESNSGEPSGSMPSATQQAPSSSSENG